MNMRTLTLTIICAAFACATVQAQSCDKKAKHGAKKNHFAAMDANNDGTVSSAEFATMHEKRVAAMKERMGDRYDPERAAKRPSAGEIFTRIDTDGNGALKSTVYCDSFMCHLVLSFLRSSVGFALSTTTRWKASSFCETPSSVRWLRSSSIETRAV